MRPSDPSFTRSPVTMSTIRPCSSGGRGSWLGIGYSAVRSRLAPRAKIPHSLHELRVKSIKARPVVAAVYERVDHAALHKPSQVIVVSSNCVIQVESDPGKISHNCMRYMTTRAGVRQVCVLGQGGRRHVDGHRSWERHRAILVIRRGEQLTAWPGHG